MFKLSGLKLSLVLGMAFLLTACNNDANLKERIAQILKENPDIVTKSIEENPAAYVEAIQKAVSSAQDEMRNERQKL